MKQGQEEVGAIAEGTLNAINFKFSHFLFSVTTL